MYEPFEYMKRMHEEVDDAFDRFFSRSQRRPLLTSGEENAVAPREPLLDIVDGGDSLRLVAELPGVDRKDIEVNVTDDSVTLNAEKKTEETREDEGYFHQERRYSSFQRSIRLPAEVVAEDTKAEYKNGVLQLELKKKHEAGRKEHRVEVK